MIGVSIMLCMTEQLSAQSAPIADEDPFVAVVSVARASVVAVGTFDPRDTPSVRYMGSGFAVDDGRTIVTNAHVVQGARELKAEDKLSVFFPDLVAADGERLEGRKFEGRRVTVLLEDRHRDLALLRFEGPALRALPLAEEDPPQGRSVGIIGYPIGTALGLVPAVHKGVVAAIVPAVLPLPKGAELTPELAAAIRDPYNLYQLDLIVFPGNSGSPLLDARNGRVLGIINKTLAGRTREHLLSQPSGVSYAVPSRWIRSLIRRAEFEAVGVKPTVTDPLSPRERVPQPPRGGARSGEGRSSHDAENSGKQ